MIVAYTHHFNCVFVCVCLCVYVHVYICVMFVCVYILLFLALKELSVSSKRSTSVCKHIISH